jgi:hypothetical protein
MIVKFGKHSGQTVEEIVLRDPDYIVWLLRQEAPRGQMEAICDEVRRLIRVFDCKPFAAGCSGCEATATRCSVYEGPNLALQCWCDACDPYSAGAGPGKLRVIRTYTDAIRHVASQCRRGKREYEMVIRDLAQAKGLPERARANRIRAFFAG